ncbi:MAG: hypothetical protein JXA16_14200 [Bacteroidales bacterium]|nr:hypothetical protein [Bacteroidales bacterium]
MISFISAYQIRCYFRRIIFIILLLNWHFSSFAQDCSKLIESKYDEFTGDTVKQMKDRIYISQNNIQKVALFVAQKIEEDGEKEIVLTINLRDNYCIDNLNGIILLFEDNTKLKEYNHGGDNCEGFTMLNIGIPNYEDKTIKSYLESKKLKGLRVYTNNNFVEVFLSVDNQLKLINSLKCFN